MEEKPYIWQYLDFDNPKHRSAYQYFRTHGFWPDWIIPIIRSEFVIMGECWNSMCLQKYCNWLEEQLRKTYLMHLLSS